MVAGIPEWTPVTKTVRVGDTSVELHQDGSVTIHNHRWIARWSRCLIGSELTRLTRSEIDDLLVALDAVTNEARDPDPKSWSEQIPRGLLSLARDVYAATATRATVELTVHPSVWHTIAASQSPFTGDRAWEAQNGLLRFYDGTTVIRRGS